MKDLKTGRISSQLALEPETRSLLDAKLKPQPQRAERLSQEFQHGWKGIARRLWPKLTYVSCVAGGSFSVYMEKLNLYTENLPVYSAVMGQLKP